MRTYINLIESAEQLDEINFKKAAATAGLIGALATGSVGASEPIDLSQVIGQPVTSAMQAADFNPLKDERLSDFMRLAYQDSWLYGHKYPMISRIFSGGKVPSSEYVKDVIAYAEYKKTTLHPRREKTDIAELDYALTILKKSKADYKPQVASYNINTALEKRELIPGITGWSVNDRDGKVTSIINHFQSVWFFDYTDKITAKYGKPTTTRTETRQNSFGVQVENYIYMWEVNGLKIFAMRHLNMSNGYMEITSEWSEYALLYRS